MADILDTSLLVTILQGNTIHTSPICKKYRSMINLDAGRKLANKYATYSGLYAHIVKNRKHCILNHALKYAKPNTQFVILASGIDTLSLELAFRKKDLRIFEVDINLMDEKSKLLHKVSKKYSKSIHCITADINKPRLFTKRLEQHGFNKKYPTIVIAEGISYYIKKDKFWRMLKLFSTKTLSNKLILEYVRPLINIKKSTRHIVEFSFYTIVRDLNLDGLTHYTINMIQPEIAKLGGSIIDTKTMKDIEKIRFGKNTRFMSHDDIGIEVCLASI